MIHVYEYYENQISRSEPGSFIFSRALDPGYDLYRWFHEQIVSKTRYPASGGFQRLQGIYYRPFNHEMLEREVIRWYQHEKTSRSGRVMELLYDLEYDTRLWIAIPVRKP